MQIHPYLTFNGNCAEAFKLYERVLEGQIVSMMTHGDSPIAGQVPPGWHDRILHVHLAVGDAVLLGSDAPPEHYAKPQGLQVSVQVKDPAKAERIFKALSDKGTVTMPFEKTFWAERFGMLVDRFGIPWMVNCAPAADASLQGTPASDLAEAR
jgi:PhnB protein